MFEHYVDQEEFEEFLAVAETGDIERGDLQENLQRIAFLAITGDPKLKQAVTTFREDLNCHELVKFYGWAYANYIDKQFAKKLKETADFNHLYNDDFPLNVPYIGGTCESEKIPQASHRVCRALAARARFKAEKPDWAPELPIKCEEIEKLLRGRMKLVGLFANSWYRQGWRPHSSFADYCAGLSALPHTADLVRGTDPALFNPRPLPGLDPRTTLWTPPHPR
jgi:hypothetical protein